MKKILVWLVLLVFCRIPVAEWTKFTEQQRGRFVQKVIWYYQNEIDQTCSKVRIGYYEGGDGFVYVDVQCLDEAEVEQAAYMPL